MFKIGDKIVYPMHGAGIITEVQNKEVLGVKKDYYILKMPMGEMKISIVKLIFLQIGIKGTKKISKN